MSDFKVYENVITIIKQKRYLNPLNKNKQNNIIITTHIMFIYNTTFQTPSRCFKLYTFYENPYKKGSLGVRINLKQYLVYHH